LRVNGVTEPGGTGNVTGAPLTVAANTLGAPAMTVTGPVAGTVCDWPAWRSPVNNTVPEASVAWTQHSPLVAEKASE
jgi:hypothetical protein